MLSAAQKRKTGSYYTQKRIAEFIVKWAIKDPSDIVLEPSFGEGVFIEATADRLSGLGCIRPNIIAAELSRNLFDKYNDNNTINLTKYQGDFLQFDLIQKVNAVVGNPPYVSLKNLSEQLQLSARSVLSRHGIAISQNGSVWLPFVLHSTDSLIDNGKLAFVLPFEITYTRYAFGMWDFLCSNYSNITVIRLYEDFFPDVDVETVLLLADGKGGTSNSVNYSVHSSVNNLFEGKPIIEKQIELADIVNNKKPFVSSLLSDSGTAVLTDLINKNIIEPITDYCKFKIGYVSADKEFFHPNDDVVKRFNLPKENLIPCILNAKEINGGTGIGVFAKKGKCNSSLFLPQNPTAEDIEYIKHGESCRVSERYKCRNRKPWYITPNIEIPDVILTVFGDLPKLIINSGNYIVSNSLLCGILKNTMSAEQFVSMWYNSLTLLSLELTAHSLGGGSFVIIPGEADLLKLVRPVDKDVAENICRKIDNCIKNVSLNEAYLLGDKLVLRDIYGLTNEQIMTIRESVEILRQWRIPFGRRAAE